LVQPEPVILPEPPDEGDDREDREEAQFDAAPEAVVSAAEPAEGNSSSEQSADRGFRGDRRGRRSRRRRQRGRGFPENKYAQPSTGEPATAPVQQQTGAPFAATGNALEETSSEVLLLPGESLAKYRNKGGNSRAASPVDADESAEPPHDEPIGERGINSATKEELASEADELSMADKVFAHHGSLSPAEVEEGIAEVEEDEGDLSVETEQAAPVNAQTETLETPHLERFSASKERVNFEPAYAELGHEPSDAPLPSPTPLPLDEFEMAAIQESLPNDSGFVGNSLDEPSLEQFEESVVPSPDSSIGKSSEEVQTASLREQGGRYMHRASRRMRRRRGGNRSGPSTQEVGPEPRRETTLLTSAGGTAVAPEPLAESPHERSDERIGVDRADRVYPSISDLLKPGQEIIVQIAKEPLGQKGARITSHIALPGRFVVFMPSVNHLGVSRKVGTEEERQRLKRILQTHRVGTTGGFIVRTAGEGVPEDEIAADMNFLYSLWLDIRQKAEKKPAPALLHYDLDVVQRILRDQLTEDFKSVWVDNEELYENVLTFMQRFQPALVNRVKMYTRPAPIFDAFNITQELEKALRPKVWLKSGGYIVINQTEALVAIDINTGKYVGKSNRLEDTIVKTNTEAVKEIVRQIRLRDLGGIIVVDFIDMDERKNRQKVMQTLEEAMRADKAPYKILQFNDFGLVAITRKRVKQSLERTLCAPCPYCEGAGYVKSVQTVISEILVEAQKIARAIEGKDVVLRVHPEVAKVLKASSNQYLEELEEILGRPVLVTGDPTLHHQKFDLG
jgi:ribonuclease G